MSLAFFRYDDSLWPHIYVSESVSQLVSDLSGFIVCKIRFSQLGINASIRIPMPTC